MPSGRNVFAKQIEIVALGLEGVLLEVIAHAATEFATEVL